MDLMVSILGLVLLLPLLSVIGALVKREDGGPVFYRGVRIGLAGKTFRMYKFRTMIVNAERAGGSSTSADDSRITRIGRRIRASKLDELPQLINVLRGDMSLVGPRPQVPWAVALYSQEEREILEIKPGMTDPASLRFHNEGELLRGSADPDRDYFMKIHPTKMALSLQYMREASFKTDMKILIMTLKRVFLA
jgi:lipopolysaccharide/colanic/teichoic acid biosynthesis glycosyltransferase